MSCMDKRVDVLHFCIMYHRRRDRKLTSAGYHHTLCCVKYARTKVNDVLRTLFLPSHDDVQRYSSSIITPNNTRVLRQNISHQKKKNDWCEIRNKVMFVKPAKERKHAWYIQQYK